MATTVSFVEICNALRRAATAATFEAWIAEVEQLAREIVAADGDELDIEKKRLPLWYAKRIVRLIGIVRGSIQRSDAAGTAYGAVQLGALVIAADLTSDADNGVRWLDIQIEAANARNEAIKAKNSARNVNMAEAFLKRKRENYLIGAGYSDSDLMRFVGRKWKEPLKRSAAIAAINDGLRQLGQQSVRSSREPNKTCERTGRT